MARREALAVLAVVGLCAGTAGAQRRPYDAIMKEVGATVSTMRKGLDGGAVGAAAADAEKLQRLFQEVEEFWTPFRTKDAIDAARGAKETAAAIAAAAKANDQTKVTAAAAGLGRYCTTCHDSHREQMPDKSYRIRP